MKRDDRLYTFENTFENHELKLSVGDVFQVAEVSLEKGGEFFEHEQVCDELTYAVSGSAKIYSNDECDMLCAGQIHYVRKGINHRIEALPEQKFRYVCIGVHPDIANSAAAAFVRAAEGKTNFVINDNGYVKRLSELLMREFYNWDEHSEEMVNTFITQILITVHRVLSNKKENLYDRKGKKSSSYAMYKLLRYIDSEYIQISSVKEVAQTLSYSEYYLSHLFKEKMGITMKEYINRKKMNFAKELLENCDLTMEQLAEYLKFADPRAFRRTFKQYTGRTPSEYRDKK